MNTSNLKELELLISQYCCRNELELFEAIGNCLELCHDTASDEPIVTRDNYMDYLPAFKKSYDSWVQGHTEDEY